MFDDFKQYALGSQPMIDENDIFDDNKSDVSKTSWLGSMMSTKDANGILGKLINSLFLNFQIDGDDMEAEGLLGKREPLNPEATKSSFSVLKIFSASFYEDNKYTKSLKGYSNYKIAIGLWILGLVLLFLSL